uniref:Uncharacterized protein n=1 Tax=Anguilla anguilla TaxID=7936 RepID=A0A0E9QT86_ANGAN
MLFCTPSGVLLPVVDFIMFDQVWITT